jgi:putative oxidoreductase
MLRRLLYTSNDYTLTVARLIFGVVFFAHGAQKTLGWFGGPGYAATMHGFQQSGIPAVLAFLAIAAEFLGGLGLIVGLLGRVAAFGVMCNMVVAIAMVHLPHGFFMNWTGSQSGEGFEYHLLALALGFVLLIRGSGAFSVDHFLTAHRPETLRRVPADRAA